MSARSWRGRVGASRQSGQGGGCIGGTLEGDTAGQGLVGHDAQGVHVGAGIHRAPFDLLGSQVANRADHHPGLGEVGGLGVGLGDTEVGDQDLAVVADQDVGRLHVAVHKAGPVGGRQTLGGLGHDVDGLGGVQRPVFVQVGAQVPAPDEFHHDGLARVVRAGVEDGHHVGVAQSGHGHRLGPETGHEGGVPGQVGVQHLHGHLALEHGVGGLPHRGHPPLGQHP